MKKLILYILLLLSPNIIPLVELYPQTHRYDDRRQDEMDYEDPYYERSSDLSDENPFENPFKLLLFFVFFGGAIYVIFQLGKG